MPQTSSGNEVSQLEAEAAWVPVARELLIETAGTYGSWITYEALASHVQQATGITTKQLLPNWIGGLLDKVGQDAESRGEPHLTSLCVRKDQTIGDGYPWAPDEASELEREETAARDRLDCYVRYARNVPADGGIPTLTPLVEKKLNRGGSAVSRADTTPSVLVDRTSTQFWWASQSKNYETAIEQRGLWSLPMSDGVISRDRDAIRRMHSGDIVFHYKGPALRAVSVVIGSSEDATRPDGYPKSTPTEGDDGWRIEVDPIRIDLDLDWHNVRDLITHGEPGPLDRSGTPRRKYISWLSAQDGLALLAATGVKVDDELDEEVLGHSRGYWGDGDTDAASLGTVRREQSYLRAHLLDGRHTAACALCGRSLPAKLLVAAHIKPRSKCTDEERWDFAAAAMLACTLGCDALFEWGYIVVDATGNIVAGRETTTSDLAAAVNERVGGSCSAHNSITARNFAVHYRAAV